jgi:sodium pump decarboxylase gamma subunit
MTPFMQGLNVSVLGLLITFMSLGVFILIMVGLQKLFPGREEAAEEQETGMPVVEVETADTSEEGAVIAAIAAAVAYARATGRGQLGARLTQPRGSWWMARRMEARPGVMKRR